MYTGQKQYEIGLYEKAVPPELSWRDKLLAAKEAGFDYMEISIDETEEKIARLDMGREEMEKLMRTMHETGLPIRSMCLSGHRKNPLGSSSPQIERRAVEMMEKAIDFADELGIRTIQLAGYDVYYEKGTEETRQRFKKNLAKAVDMAAKKGVMLGFETMETEFMNTVSKSMEFVQEMDSIYLGVYPDVGNLTNASCLYHSDIEEDIMKGKGHIAAVHLKETKPGIFREVPFGMGHVDFPKMISVFWEMGVRRYVTELWYTGSADWKKDILDARERMERILEECERSQI